MAVVNVSMYKYQNQAFSFLTSVGTWVYKVSPGLCGFLFGKSFKLVAYTRNVIRTRDETGL